MSGGGPVRSSTASLCDTCRTGRAISPQGRVHTEVDRMAAALADMLDAHLDRFRARRAS